MIEIRQPELESIILERFRTGLFQDVEDVIMQAMKSSSLPAVETPGTTSPTGAEILAALQRSPFKGLDIDFERLRRPMPVRDFEF